MKTKKIAVAGIFFSLASAAGAFAAPLADRLSAVSEQSSAALAAQTPEAAWSGSGAILDGTPASAPAPVVVAPPDQPRKTGLVPGLKNGARAGGWVGFGGTLSPAVALLSEGFGRNMSRGYDGARSGNANGGWYTAAGIALAAVLYVPALVLGGICALGGAAAGGVSELVKPGSTQKWDGESVIS